MNDIVMPKLSDTMTEGRLVSWKKRVGEAVRRGDVLAEVETDKANMELEAFVSGVLQEIRVQAGEMAQVGTVIAVIGSAEEKGAQSAQPAATEEPAVAKPQQEPAARPQPETSAPSAAAATREAAATVEEPGETPQPRNDAPQGGPQGRQETAAAGGQPPVTDQQDESQAPAAPQAPGSGETQTAAAPPKAAEAAGAPAAAGGTEAGDGEAQAPGESRERAAPVVRRRAREIGIDLTSVQGSGPDGRILLQDLERHGQAPAEPGQPSAPVAKPAAGEPRPLSRLRAAIAKTVSESWRSIPHFDVTMELLMDDAEAIRKQLKQSGLAVTWTDLVVKGVSLALQKFPLLNAAFAADGVRLLDEINIGVAVSVPDGVLVPVIRGCQALSLAEISGAGRDLAGRARAGSLSEPEMGGGTFSVSNMGMYGVSQFSAIIYPSQAAVLAVGAVLDTVVVEAGAPACAKVMKVTLSADHRLVDGAYAARFLAEFKEILEHPLRLLL